MTTPLPPDVRAAMDASRKIEAIRLLRAQTGLGLAEAKEAVEVGYVRTDSQPRRALPTALPAEAVAALQRGSKIDAIRTVRAKFGIGLKDAKALVDAAAASHTHGLGESATGLAPGEVQPSRFGKASFLLVCALLAMAVWWMYTGT